MEEREQIKKGCREKDRNYGIYTNERTARKKKHRESG